jgi:hypothetical protein
MGTRFYADLLAGTELHRLTEEALAKKAENDRRNTDGLTYRVSDVTFHGMRLIYSSERRAWFVYYNDLLLTPPPSLLQFTRHGFDLTIAEITKNYGVVSSYSPYQGEYVGGKGFEGCTATVDNRTEKEVGPRQMIRVTGPIDTYAAYFAEVRSRGVKPTIWMESRPGLVMRCLRALRLVAR